MPSRRMLGYGRQAVDESDVEAVAAVLRSDFLTQGPVVERFEAALAERVGARYAVAVSSGTAALHVACLAAGVQAGDYGLTTPLTFVASANCVVYCGGQTRLADIDKDTLGLAPAKVAAALEAFPQAKVVIPVHYAGLAIDMAALRAVAGQRILIEDASHALGGEYADGQPVGGGAYAEMTVFSFHPVKPITSAEGGAVMTNDPELARRLRMFRNHGIERDVAKFSADAPDAGAPWYYEQQLLGFNYRLADVQAALGLSQLARLDSFVRRRRAIAGVYDDAFAKLPHVSLPQSAAEQRARSGLHLYTLHVDFAALSMTRAQLVERLHAKGVGSQVHYIPVHRQPFYRQHLEMDGRAYPEAERFYAGCLSLPFYPGMTDEDVAYVVATVREALQT